MTKKEIIGGGGCGIGEVRRFIPRNSTYGSITNGMPLTPSSPLFVGDDSR